MKKIYRSLWLVCVVIAGWGCHVQEQKGIPSLQETYRRTDKQPFGAFIAYQQFRSEFSGYWINVADKPFDDTWNEMKGNISRYSVYFLITKNLLLSTEEVNAMLEFVKSGNDLFISADYIDKKLLQAVYCSLYRQEEIAAEVNGVMHDTHVGLYFGKEISDIEKYGYYYYPFANYFSSFDTAYARVLGVNDEGRPNYLVLFAGKGKIYLHVAPRSFSNYFLLTGENHLYFDYVTSYLGFDPQYVYWDEFYKNTSSTRNKDQIGNRRNKQAFSSMRVIYQNPPLQWAFYILLAGILLFIAFRAKRKQRVMEVIRPNSNATLAFTETIGRLYLQGKSNKSMAEKMITFFYEYLRRKYYVDTGDINEAFLAALSRKSNVPPAETNELFELIKNIHSQENVTDAELLQLNKKIENFKKIKPDGRKLV